MQDKKAEKTEIEADKERLALKIMSGGRLTADERSAAYRYITGNEPTSIKRGRPSTIERDIELAKDYLLAHETKNKDKLRSELAKKHGLSAENNTFYMSLNRGIEALYIDIGIIKNIYMSGGRFYDLEDEYNRLYHLASLIEKYKKIEGYDPNRESDALIKDLPDEYKKP